MHSRADPRGVHVTRDYPPPRRVGTAADVPAVADWARRQRVDCTWEQAWRARLPSYGGALGHPKPKIG